MAKSSKREQHRFTIEDLQRLELEGFIRGFKILGEPQKELAAKRSKYGAQKTELDGITFDSHKEAKRYCELRMLKKAGEITELQLQVPYELNEGGTHSMKYIADFVYRRKDGTQVVEDVKGYRTAVYKKKRRLMKQLHNIEIHEI